MKTPTIFAIPDSISSCAAAARLLAEKRWKGDDEHYLVFCPDVNSAADQEKLLEAVRLHFNLGSRKMYFAGYNANAVEYVSKHFPIDAERIDILHCKDYSLISAAWWVGFWHSGGKEMAPKVFEWANADDFVYWLSHAMYHTYSPEEDEEAFALIEAAKEEYRAQPPIHIGYRCCSCNARFKFPTTLKDSHG